MEVFFEQEMRRILSLPQRQPLTPDEAAQAAALFTTRLAQPGSTRKFNLAQGAALYDLVTYGRMYGSLAPGAGKTDLTAVAPGLLGAQRALVLVPAALRRKTIDSLRAAQAYWRGVPDPLDVGDRAVPGVPTLRVLAYDSLSRTDYAAYLEEYDPDLILPDEAHCVAVATSGRGRRFYRFIRNKRRRGGKVTVVPLTGTGWGRSLKKNAYLFEACFEGQSPLPTEYNALEQWCAAVDQGVREHERLEPGALLQFCTPDQAARGVEGVREAIRERVLHTPGYVATKEVTCGIPLILQRRPVTVPASVAEAMRVLREDNLLPSGDYCEDGVVLWGHLREIANGFAYHYDPPPPMAWRICKGAWVRFVRETIKAGSKYDTPLQVWQAVAQGKLGRVQAFEEWVAIKDTYRPNSVPHWIDDYLVRDAEAWAKSTGGIVWVQHSTAHTNEPDDDALGGQFRDIPYFGGGDERIRTYRGPCAASVRAHGTGKDLYQWSEALLMGIPSSGQTMEQLLARLHREGQKADVVRFWFYAHSLENLKAVTTSKADAEHVQALSGQEQRILMAEWLDADGSVFDTEAYNRSQTGPMWG